MPRRHLRPKGYDRNRSLGWLAVWWIETFVVHGPGDVEGQPIIHNDEYTGFLLDAYLLHEKGRRMVDSAFLSRPKGANKSGLAAEIALFEALGPCRFAGWANGGEEYEFLGHTYTYQKGEPMGRPVTTPLIRIMATEEGQTGNVYDLCYENLLVDNGYPLADLNAYGMDVNRGLIRLPFGGEIMPSTTGSASKDGGKETFVVFDETHLYNTPGLRDMYKTVTRNLVKRKRMAEPWFIETTTMYSVGEDSIAEASYEYADLVEEGKTRRDKVLFDHRWGQIEDLSDEEALRVALTEAYGGALDWMDMESLIDDIFDPRRSEVESRRYFLNTLTSASNAWLEHVELELVSGQREVPKDGTEEVVLGFDGALTRDATALVACRLSDGYIWPLKIEEQPDSAEAKDWVVDQEGFDAAVYQAHIDYKVRGFFADPPHWQDYLDKWEREFGETWIVSASTRGSKIKFWTARDTTMDRALERFHTNITTQRVVISTDKTLQRHILNARTQNRRGGTVITKETKNSPKKIDAAMAATLAHEARAVALNEEVEEEETWVPRRVR